MNINHILFLPILVISSCSLTQQDNTEEQQLISNYLTNTRKADTAYRNKDFIKCTNYYELAFKNKDPWIEQSFIAACCFAQTNQIDKAFKYLENAIKLGYSDMNELLESQDLNNLKNDIRWKITISNLKSILEDKGSKKNESYRKELIDMKEEDQKLMIEMDEIINRNGRNSKKFKKFSERAENISRKHIKKLEELIIKYGWPQRKTVGSDALFAAWLLIQHSDLQTQEKYYPLIENSVNKGELKKSNLAFLKDRILVNQGKNQIYGTQVFYNNKTNRYELQPIEDVESVNLKRIEMGLPPLNEYLKKWNIILDAPNK